MNISLYQSAYQAIQKADRILLVGHINADVDALSALGAMIEIVEKINKPYLAYAEQKTNQELNFLPHEEKIINNKESLIQQISNLNYLNTSYLNNSWLENFDLIIALDCGSFARTNLLTEFNSTNKKPLIIELDHHPKTDSYGNIEIRLPEAVSTTEIIYYFCKANHLSINRTLANCILAGMLTDTGNFLYPNTTDEALEIASEMLDYGAQFPKIVSDTWRNKDFITMKIWGLALANLKINPRYNFAVTILPYQELQSIFKDLAMEDYHFEGDSLAGFLSNLSGVKGLLLLREESPGKLKGSLRSAQKNIDVSKLARFLGGGGHAKSSGFTITGNIQKNNNYYKII